MRSMVSPLSVRLANVDLRGIGKSILEHLPNTCGVKRYMSKVIKLLSLLVLVGLAVYFRTYGIHSDYNKSPYYMGSDSYHYLQLVNVLEKGGQLQAKDGNYFNPLRNAPDGLWSQVTWHPYVLYYFNKFLPMKWFPVCVVLLIIPLFFCACKLLEFDFISTWFGCLILILSPVGIQRSFYGWMDTDCYNIIFPLAIFITLVYQCTQSRLLCGILGGILSAIYALCWTGGLSYVLVTCGVLIIGLFWGTSSRYLLGYVFGFLLALLFAVGLGGVENILHGIVEPFLLIGKTNSATTPNVFLTIGEQKAVGIDRLCALSSSQVSWLLALCSLNFAWIYSRRVSYVMMLIIGYLSIFTVLSFCGERYTLFVSLWVALSCAGGIWLMQRVLASKKIRLMWLTLLLLAILPWQLLVCHGIAIRSLPIKDHAWEKMLNYIKDTTSEDTIIVGWWCGGYFVQEGTGLRTIGDGGTQMLPSTKMAAQFLLMEDEDKALALLKNYLMRDGKVPPVKVLVYRELAEQFKSLLLVGNWNPERASQVYASRKGKFIWQTMEQRERQSMKDSTYISSIYTLSPKSLLAQLFYVFGKNLKHFKLDHLVYSQDNKNVLVLFDVTWD